MKHILIEGGDRLGKSSLIEGICKHYNFDNITVRHFGKPPRDLKGMAAFGFQMTCFEKEAEFLRFIRDINNDEDSLGVSDYFKYDYENIMVWNRSHLGEYVYAQMFREVYPEFLKTKLINYEIAWLVGDDETNNNTYLITLTADPEFFFSKEDGNSFSQKLEDKTKELELFKEAHEFSTIKNKLMVKVDKEKSKFQKWDDEQFGITQHDKFIFRPKQDILNEVLQFIK